MFTGRPRALTDSPFGSADGHSPRDRAVPFTFTFTFRFGAGDPELA
ncbi:hypothetical protein [Planotetraspora mira]|nr:hypothetical protein [Planotetraspora mira]